MTVKARETKCNISDVLTSSQTSSVSKCSATRPSLPYQQVPSIRALTGVCEFSQGDIFVDKSKVLGKEVFGKCNFGSVGPQSACIKIVRKGPWFEASFTNDVQASSA